MKEMKTTKALNFEELLEIDGGGTLPYTGGTYTGLVDLTSGFVDGFTQGWEDIGETISKVMN